MNKKQYSGGGIRGFFALTAQLLLAAALFAACSAPAGDILSYQERGAHISGIIKTETGAYYINITTEAPAADESGELRRDAVIEFSYPSAVDGLTARIEGEGITLELDGVTLPVTPDATGLDEIMSLFLLCRDEMFSLERDGAFIVAAFGRAGDENPDGDPGGDENERSGIVYLTLDGESSLPVRIYTSDGKLDFDIREYTPSADTEPAE